MIKSIKSTSFIGKGDEQMFKKGLQLCLGNIVYVCNNISNTADKHSCESRKWGNCR